MLTFKNLLGDNTVADIPIAHQHNLEDLLVKVRKLEMAYGKPFVVTSGYRQLQKHLEIYSRKGIHPPKVPMKSQHLSGCAVDIADADGKINEFCKNNNKLIEELGLWLENRQGSWQHIQTVPFKSFKTGGTRWFNP